MADRQFIWYSSSHYEQPDRYRFELSPTDDIHSPPEQMAIAKRCADDFRQRFHPRLIGIYHWPCDVTLYASECGPPLASFEVECEPAFEFYARRKDVAA